MQKKAISVILYSQKLDADWDRFVEKEAINATFLHTRKFYNHNPLNATDDMSLMFYKMNRLIAVLPAILHKVDHRLVLHSHLRATYGGFIVSNKVTLEGAIQLVEETVRFARDNDVQEIVIRNPFRIYHNRLCDETDYAMWSCGFKVKSREIETAVSLKDDIQTIRSHYHKGTKYSVGKARRNVEVRLSEDFEDFWRILNVSLMERHNQKPVHDYAAICKLREKVGKERVILFGAYYRDKLIGGNVVFNFNNVLHGQYNASDLNFRFLTPLHAVVDYILEWGHSRGFEYFNMGMSNEAAGKEINTGLLRYKEGFGGRGILRETMNLNLDYSS